MFHERLESFDELALFYQLWWKFKKNKYIVVDIFLLFSKQRAFFLNGTTVTLQSGEKSSQAGYFT